MSLQQGIKGGVLLVAVVFLSGCANEAVRQAPEKGLELSFSKEASKENVATQQNKGESSLERSSVKNQPVKKNETTMKDVKQYPTYPAMNIDPEKKYTATVKTSVGEMTLALNAKDTPKTVNNFVFLAREGFYNGVIFHRTIPGFMIQGGDPTGTGSGGPGYRFPDEPFTGEYKRGTIAMANAGPDTNGSQFFIMHADYPLPKNYVIFGEVLSGIETVDTIASAPTESGGEGSRPVNPVTIESVTIVEE